MECVHLFFISQLFILHILFLCDRSFLEVPTQPGEGPQQSINLWFLLVFSKIVHRFVQFLTLCTYDLYFLSHLLLPEALRGIPTGIIDPILQGRKMKGKDVKCFTKYTELSLSKETFIWNLLRKSRPGR